MQTQKVNKQRNQKMSREQILKQRKDMELPVNKFLNAKDKNGNLKYPLAEILRKYFLNNPDPILDDMRMANAFLHEIRWRKNQAQKYLDEYNKSDIIEMKDNDGKLLTKDDCYLAYISQEQNVYLALSRLREHLVTKLLAKCDGEFFSFDQYNEFVTKISDIIEKYGYELFPDSVKLIEPQ